MWVPFFFCGGRDAPADRPVSVLFFPAVCDLFPFDRLRGRNSGVFIVTIDLCTQFQVFPPFFFQFSSCFIILQTDLFCFIQCIILPFLYSVSFSIFFSSLLAFLFACSSPSAYLPVPETNNYGHGSFSMGGSSIQCTFFHCCNQSIPRVRCRL